MRILLDECVDRRLAKDIEGHEVVTVPQAGWAGLQNGDLLRLAQREFDIFITVDRNLSFQQSVGRFSIAIIVLESPIPLRTHSLDSRFLAGSRNCCKEVGP